MRSAGLALFIFLFFCHSLRGQQLPPALDANKVNLKLEISDSCQTAFIKKNDSLTLVYSRLVFKKGLIFHGPIPNDHVTKKAIVRIRVYNSGDTSRILYFFPGFFVPHLRLYKDSGGRLSTLPDIYPPVKEKISFRGIQIAAHDSITVVAEINFLKTYNNKLRPRLVSPEYVLAFTLYARNTNRESDIASYIFCGLLLMMILYSFANYFQGGRIEFFYYSCYAILIGLMLLSKAVFNYRAIPVNFFIEEYLDFILQCLGLVFYMQFMQLFLETKTRYRLLYKLYSRGIWLLCIAVLAYTYFHYFTDNFSVENFVENGTKMALLVMVIIFLVYSARHWQESLLRYLFWGNLFFLVFSILSLVLILVPGRFGLKGLFGNSLLYYEAGLLFELIFFLSALNHKNRTQIIEETREREMLKAQNILKEYEKEMAVYKAQQEERQRISADMHDELGSGMTAIRLMSEIARNKMKEQTPVEIEKISRSANDVLNKMNAIIWSMNSSNDTLASLVSYIRNYANEFFDNMPVHCKVIAPEFNETIEISGEKRRNIFLCVKESLNNILKHAQATQVEIEIRANDVLEIRIRDNGIGIDMNKPNLFRNGLKNMRHRMETIGGSIELRSENGTLTTIRLPLSTLPV